MRRFLLLSGAVAALVAALWKAWHMGHDAADQEAKAALERAKRRDAAVAVRVETRYLARAAQIRTVYRTIHDEIPTYLTPLTDLRFPVPVGAVRLHDAAAQGVLPGAPSELDGAASDVPISRFVGVVVDNYQGCAVDRARLVALQDWAAAVSSLHGDTDSPSPDAAFPHGAATDVPKEVPTVLDGPGRP